MIYKESYWYETTQEKLESKDILIDEEKSYLVMFNVDINGEVLITNVYPGNGFLLGREFHKVTSGELNFIENYIENINSPEKNI